MNEKVILGRDGVAVNAETDYSSFPVEPLNAVSNLIFLIVLFYWIKKVGFNFKRYPLIVTGMPLLFFGVLASIMHHLFRAEKAWNSAGMIAVFYAVIMVCVYLWYRIAGKWLNAFLYTMAVPLFFWVFSLLPEVTHKLTVSVLFAAFSVTVVLPAMVLCIKNRLKHLETLGIASFLFTLAIFFRIVDLKAVSYFSRGTHFLWHIFGAVTLFFLIKFIYLIDEDRAIH